MIKVLKDDFGFIKSTFAPATSTSFRSVRVGERWGGGGTIAVGGHCRRPTFNVLSAGKLTCLDATSTVPELPTILQPCSPTMCTITLRPCVSAMSRSRQICGSLWQEVEFLVITEPKKSQRDGSKRDLLRAMQISFLPQGTVKFETLVAKGRTGVVKRGTTDTGDKRTLKNKSRGTVRVALPPVEGDEAEAAVAADGTEAAVAAVVRRPWGAEVVASYPADEEGRPAADGRRGDA